MFTSLLRAATVLLALAATPSVQAQSLVRLDVVDRDSGRILPAWAHAGERWVEGAPGHRYALRLANLGNARVLVVVSVDGVNVVSGQTARTDQAGYVLAPWQTTEIAGWRKSRQDVAQFVFTDLQASYAARTGRPDEVGAIGVAAFRERAPISAQPMPGAPRLGDNEAARAPAASAEAAAMPQQLGTGHGEREWAPVDETTFVRASPRPQQQMQLRYDTRERLLALGVLPRVPTLARRPQAFPAGFVPDP